MLHCTSIPFILGRGDDADGYAGHSRLSWHVGVTLGRSRPIRRILKRGYRCYVRPWYTITGGFIQIVDDVVGMIMYFVDPVPRITIWN